MLKLPFWRARGILKVNKHGDVRYSLVNWNTEEHSDIINGQYLLERNGYKVLLNAGTVIED